MTRLLPSETKAPLVIKDVNKFVKNLILIVDLPEDLNSKKKLFGDNHSLFVVVTGNQINGNTVDSR